MAELDDSRTGGCSSFGDREYVTTTAVVRIDDYVNAADELCGGGAIASWLIGSRRLRRQHTALSPV